MGTAVEHSVPEELSRHL